MAPASGGQRKTKTKSKAKAVSPKRAPQGEDELVREPSIPILSQEKELSGGSCTSSPTEAGMEHGTSGPSPRTDLVRDADGLDRGIESENNKVAQFSTDPVQKETTGQIHGEEMHRRITERAFLLYAEGGFRHGYDLDHWLEAEREIMIRHRG